MRRRSNSEAADAPAKEQLLELAAEELDDAGLGDARLDSRLVEILAARMSRSDASIPQSCGDWASTKAAYRFFSNDTVKPEAILSRHRRSTLERARGRPVLLVLCDTSMLDFTGQEETTGLGPLSDRENRGFLIHPALVVTPDRVALGLYDNYVWVRKDADHGKRVERCKKRLIGQKESKKWLESINAAEALQADLKDDETLVVSVFDREGDIFDVLSKAADPTTKSRLLIRAIHNRQVDEPEKKLWDFMKSQPVVGKFQITVPRKSGVRKRTAILSMRFAEVTLQVPPKRPKDAPPAGPIRVTAVLAEEENPPNGVEPISWRLLTTVAVSSEADARKIVDWYCCRWMIELFFKTLKSGCRIEDRQLETFDRLQRCLAVDAIVAWMVLYLMTTARESPDIPCTAMFEDHEWKSVWHFVHKSRNLPEIPPTLMEMTRMIGRLGGHLGRKGDGPPGMMTLWRGLQRAHDIAEGWLLSKRFG